LADWTWLRNVWFLEKRKEPLEGVRWRLLLIALSILVAFAIGSLFFLPFGVDPIQAYTSLLTAGFSSRSGFAFTLMKASPMLLVGLGTVLAFRTGFRYLGFEGTVGLGAITTVWFALECQDGGLFGPLPALVFFPLATLIGFVGGGLWAGLVGFSKARLRGNEVIVSLMSNYIATLLINFLISGPMRQPGDMPQTPHVPDATRLPRILPGTRAHAGILVAIALTALVYWFLRSTTLGYKMVISGDNPKAARYSGIDVVRMVILSSFIAGGLAGIAGGYEVLGIHYRVTEGLSSDLGRLGIIAALLGGLEPVGAAVAAVLYAAMGVGAEAMQRRAAVPTPVTFTIQALVVIILLSLDILRQYRLVLPRIRLSRSGAAAEAME
jgi:simple sugar transport system permease protein